jgi:hypothetical protein
LSQALTLYLRFSSLHKPEQTSPKESAMSSLPKFDYEVFISYAHLDNEPLPDKEKGWIEQFGELLDRLLGEELGAAPKIWRDNMLRGDDFITEAILDQMPRIAVMVSVLSPRYLKSEWCLKELKHFCEAAKQTGGFRIGNKSRIYKVVKTPIRGDEPETLKDIKGYEFYQIKDKSGRPQWFAFDEEFGLEARVNFLNKVGDVAYDMANLIETLRKQAVNEQSVDPTDTVTTVAPEFIEPPSAGCVYLAEVTPDLAQEWENIRRDLLQRRYRVLPEHPLPKKLDELEKAVRADLAQCSLSIHLVGNEYGESPDDDTRSYVYLQNELAAERASDKALARLIWMPKESKPEGAEQAEFVKELLEASPVGNTDLLQTSLEDFKTTIQDTLKGKKKAAPEPVIIESSIPLVYIICDRADVETGAVKPLEIYLNALGYDTALPATKTDEADVRQDHEEKLKTCDAALVFWQSAPRLWLLTKLDDLQKIRGYGRARDLLAKAIFVTGEATVEKQRFRSLDVPFVKNFGENTQLKLEELLKPFTDQVDKGMEGRIR